MSGDAVADMQFCVGSFRNVVCENHFDMFIWLIMWLAYMLNSERVHSSREDHVGTN